MNVRAVVKGDQAIIEGPPGAPLLQSPEEVVDLIGACYEHKARSILLYAENLTDRFFDLSSGEAGAILQKLRNYHVRLAIVIPAGGMPQSGRFREMVAEESRGDEFRVFEDRASAEAWLL